MIDIARATYRTTCIYGRRGWSLRARLMSSVVSLDVGRYVVYWATKVFFVVDWLTSSIQLLILLDTHVINLFAVVKQKSIINRFWLGHTRPTCGHFHSHIYCWIVLICIFLELSVGSGHKSIKNSWHERRFPVSVTVLTERFIVSNCEIKNNKMLSYRGETALQGALQFSPKVEDWNWETIFYGHYRSIFNHCDVIGLKICRFPWKKTQNKGYYGVQNHSRSSRSVPIESPYAIAISD